MFDSVESFGWNSGVPPSEVLPLTMFHDIWKLWQEKCCFKVIPLMIWEIYYEKLARVLCLKPS